MSAPTVGSFLFDYLHKLGVTHVFGIPGDFALPTFRCMQQSPLKIITMTHEPSVGFAADGYARIHGLGVVCVTYCVGGLNMLNSVACAYAEKSPVLVISGGPSPKDRTKDILIHHKVRIFDTQQRIYAEVTCANAVLLDPETAAAEIMRVVSAVLEHSRPGYLEIPFDVVDMPIPNITPIVKKPATVSNSENLQAMLDDATAMINQAKQPIIVADLDRGGSGAESLSSRGRSRGACDEVQYPHRLHPHVEIADQRKPSIVHRRLFGTFVRRRSAELRRCVRLRHHAGRVADRCVVRLHAH